MTTLGTVSVALKHLMAAGLTGDALLDAVAEIEATLPRLIIDGSAERRRARDRTYQAGKRVNKKSAESADFPLNEVSKPLSPSEPEGSTGDCPPKVSSRLGKGGRLPDDFTAPDEWLDWAVEKRRWSRADAVDEGERFCRYWQAKTGKDATKRDWFKTWQNWVTNSHRPDGCTIAAASDRFADPEARKAYLDGLNRRESTGPPRQIADVLPKFQAESQH